MAQCKHMIGPNWQCGTPAVTGKEYCSMHGGSEPHISRQWELRIKSLRPGMRLDEILPPNAYRVFVRRYCADGEKPTLAQIGAEVGLTGQRVRQLLIRSNRLIHAYNRHFGLTKKK